MRRFLRTMAFLAIPVALIVWVVIGHHKANVKRIQEEEAREAAHQRVEQAIQQLASTHNAVDTWNSAFKSKGAVGRIYGAELSPVLVRPDGRPLLFIADVEDVAAADGSKYTCSFITKVNLSWGVKLVLECSPDQAAQVIQSTSAERFAVVAQISSLSSAEVRRSDDEAGVNAQGRFTALGKCEGLTTVGKDYREDVIEILRWPIRFGG